MLKFQTMPWVISIAIFALLGATVAYGGDLVRVDCQMESTYAATGGLFSDDSDTDPYICGGEPGEPFDYRDALDVDTACVPEDPSGDVVTSNLSGGGRWKLATVAGTAIPMRAVGANFSQNLTGGTGCADLANLGVGGDSLLGGPPCSCADATCFVQARFAADRAFKKGATRQAFVVPVLQENPENSFLWQPRLFIDYVEPLYICTTADSDERFVQTDGCAGSGDPSVAEAELIAHSSAGPDPDVSLGRWNVPVKLRLIRVPTPNGGGGSGGGCTLLPKGATCSVNEECCSNKCKGGTNKTCK